MTAIRAIFTRSRSSECNRDFGSGPVWKLAHYRDFSPIDTVDSLCYISLFRVGGRSRFSMWSSTRILRALFLSRNLRILSLLLVVTLAASVPCAAGSSHSPSVTPDAATSVDQAVRAFMQ